MENLDLKKILSKINVKADWIGLREVNEETTYRVIRDLNPESDSTFVDHGIMVEVHDRPREALSDGYQALLPSEFAVLTGEVGKLNQVLNESI